MVTDAIFHVFAVVIAFILGLLPHLGVPAWITSATSALGTVTGALNGSTGWVPWTYLAVAVALVIGSLLVSTAIRGLRIAASFLTLGGGS